MMSNVFLLVFAIAFMGCVLATPMVTRIASWAGAIDRPDQFRRIHKGAIPRLGGLALAFGLALSLLPILLGGYLREWPGFGEWWDRQWSVILAGAIVLLVGAFDDARGMRALPKLLGQALAVLILILGGIQIKGVMLLGVHIPLSAPLNVPLPWLGREMVIDFPSLVVTMLWFLGCMNIWNLIDGMDGLASGVGLLVAGTLMLVAVHAGNLGSAAMAAALAGSLAGFLLYNWHPACIFLGDSGSLLIGLLIGVIGAQGSMKGTTAVSILFPILAMGLPVTDTAMAIFRRWVRELPLSSADRRHIHHLLIGLGLTPRQAAVILYFFTAGLCGVVLLGVSWQSEFLALILGVSGCLAFLVILTSRRDELANLMADLHNRRSRKRQEREAAQVTWETIQKIELHETPEGIWETLRQAAEALGSDRMVVTCRHAGRTVLHYASDGEEFVSLDRSKGGPTATFQLHGGQDLELSVSLHQATESIIVADIAFRSLQRISLATAQRLERLLALPAAAVPASAEESSHDEAEPRSPRLASDRLDATVESVHLLNGEGVPGRDYFGWIRGALGLGATPIARQTFLGEK
jgi:UDP-GlcNAc:undecaprenyl-phosphate GlcNAc-1-phosphate transferase